MIHSDSDTRSNTNPNIAKWSSTVCGEPFQAATRCYNESTSSIKGIDCAALISAYVDCCKENEGACDPSLTEEDEEEDGEDEWVRLILSFA